MKHTFFQSILAVLLCGMFVSCAAPQEPQQNINTSAPVKTASPTTESTAASSPTPLPTYSEYDTAKANAVNALSSRLLSYQSDVYVYQD